MKPNEKLPYTEQTATLIYHAIAIHVPATNMPPLMPYILAHAQITQCASVREVCQYICNIWTHWYQPYDEQCCTQKTMVLTLTVMMQKPDCISWVDHKWKLLKISPFKTITSSQSRNCWKSVFSRPLHHPKWNWLKTSPFKTIKFSQVKIVTN